MGAPKGNNNGAGNSRYKPEYCGQVVEMGKAGKSMVQMACHFGVTKASLYDWAEKHSLFSIALARAREEMQAYLEQAGLDGLGSRDFNANLWIKTMQARFRDEYTERQKLDLSGKVSVLFSKDDKGLL